MFNFQFAFVTKLSRPPYSYVYGKVYTKRIKGLFNFQFALVTKLSSLEGIFNESEGKEFKRQT